MVRPLRIEHPGGWYHVTSRGNERRAIFRDDRDRVHFLELLENMVGRFGLRLHCYVLLDNHYHLIGLELCPGKCVMASKSLVKGIKAVKPYFCPIKLLIACKSLPYR
jgi:REP element-mobilizing transposase RayT